MMSYNKSISYDGVSDKFLRTTKNIYLINDLWKQSTIETNPKCCQARLIPLNKVYPKIPLANEFRPITVLSPLFKLLELRFLPKLQQYMLTKLNKE